VTTFVRSFALNDHDDDLKQNKCFGGAPDSTSVGSTVMAACAPIATGVRRALSNVVGRRRHARQAFGGPHSGFVLPVHPRGVTLGCPFSPSGAKVVINESVP
jgi:hypothetical protein